MPQVIVQRGSSLQEHDALEQGSFHRPFYFQFDKVVQLPPLRVRMEDLPLLALISMINKLDGYGIPRHDGDPDYAQERRDG